MADLWKLFLPPLLVLDLPLETSHSNTVSTSITVNNVAPVAQVRRTAQPGVLGDDRSLDLVLGASVSVGEAA